MVPAENVTTPEEFVVPIKFFRTVNWVSLAPAFVSVNKVLIVAFGNLNNAAFFSGDFNLATLMSSNTSSLPVSATVSKRRLPPASAPAASVPSNAIAPLTPVDSKTASAVKSWSPSASSIKNERTSENLFDTMLPVPAAIVISVLAAFSISPPVSAESDAISFSPATKFPITVVKTSVVPEVKELWTNPIAPEVAPLICTPPLVWVASKVGLGVSLKVINVNGLISKRYIFSVAVVSPWVPEECSIERHLATPICVPEAEPLVTVSLSNNCTVLYAVVSPDTAVMSGSW